MPAWLGANWYLREESSNDCFPTPSFMGVGSTPCQWMVWVPVLAEVWDWTTSFSTTRTVLEGKVVTPGAPRTHIVLEVAPGTLVPVVPAGKGRVMAFRRSREMPRTTVPGAIPFAAWRPLKSGVPSLMTTTVPGSGVLAGGEVDALG